MHKDMWLPLELSRPNIESLELMIGGFLVSVKKKKNIHHKLDISDVFEEYVGEIMEKKKGKKEYEQAMNEILD